MSKPPPLEILIKLIHFFIFFGHTEPPITRKFQSLLWRECGYFLELHIDHDMKGPICLEYFHLGKFHRNFVMLQQSVSILTVFLEAIWKSNLLKQVIN